jgi:lanthanide-dependent methanol dehydrogenase
MHGNVGSLWPLIAAVGNFLAMPVSGDEEPGSPSIFPPAGAAPAEDGQSLVPAKSFANTRYSGLNEITTENVGRLQAALPSPWA